MPSFQIAEQFFLIGHDEFSGRPAVSQELVQCGLVGALFGELMIDNRLGMTDAKVVALDARATDGGLGDRLVSAVAGQSSTHRFRTWAEQLGPDAYQLIAERLLAAGTLRREQGRKLLGRASERYPAVDLYDAARPRLMLNHVITHREEMDLHRALLAALVTAVGVEPVLGLHMGRDALRAIIASLVEAMPGDLQVLLAGMDDTVGSISLSYR